MTTHSPKGEEEVIFYLKRYIVFSKVLHPSKLRTGLHRRLVDEYEYVQDFLVLTTEVSDDEVGVWIRMRASGVWIHYQCTEDGTVVKKYS